MNSRAAPHGQRVNGRGTAFRRRVLPVLITACFAPGAPLANPSGHQVVNGLATFDRQGNVLTVTNSPGAIINWQSFSIGAGEVTRFIQQSADSCVLNRVVGQDPSQILGSLQSNGRVFLVNPNGILFGAGARVDVNGLIASTLDISNEDFLAGRMKFAGTGAGDLKNEGTINTARGGQVFLIAPNVANSGIINAPNGDVLLAAGHTVHLVDSVNPALQVVLSAPQNEALNVGEIVAQGGTASVYGALIRQRGRVSADSAVVGENGKIVFKASGDTMLEAGSVTSATGAGKGGEIQILGERVGLVGTAMVDASGKTGGGQVLVGGDFQGNNPEVRNASYTYLDRDARITADAEESGDGGRIIVWADNTTRAFGKLEARGGAQGGNGGFVEVSGKEKLEYAAATDVTAEHGKKGTLLLDPTTITIMGGNCGQCADVLQGQGEYGGPLNDPGLVFYDDYGPSVIYESQIEQQSATADIVLQASRRIYVEGEFQDGDVALAEGSSLVLETRNGLSDYGGGIDLTSSEHGADLVFRTSGSGTITIRAGTAESGQEGMDPDLLVGSLVSDADITLYARGEIRSEGRVASSGGQVSLEARNGNITLEGDLDAGSGNVSLTAENGAVTTDRATVSGNELTVRAGGRISLETYVDALRAVNTGAEPDPSISLLNGKSIELKEISQNGGSIHIETSDLAEDNAADIRVAGLVSVGPDGYATLDARGAIVNAGGTVKARMLNAFATRGVALSTEVEDMYVSNTDNATHSDINILNRGALTVTGLYQDGGNGNINFENYGAVVVGYSGSSDNPDFPEYSGSVAVQTGAGNISLTANSPMTINGVVESESGGISLVANPSANGNDDLVINSTLRTAGAIALRAGGRVEINVTPEGNYTVQQFIGRSNANATDAINTITTTINQSLNNVGQSGNANDLAQGDDGTGDDEQDENSRYDGADNNTGASDETPATKLYCN